MGRYSGTFDGIRDRVAVLGMGCTVFGERWGLDAEDLMREAFREALSDSLIEKSMIDAAWLGVGMENFSIGPGAIPMSVALKLDNIPVTKVENMCATGTEALRGASYAVASGACDVALALGVDKLKDTGYGGLPQRTRGLVNDMFWPNLSGPGAFAQLAEAYCQQHKTDRDLFKRAMAHVSVKSHANAMANPRAHLRRRVSISEVLDSPMVADPIGMLDCCGVSDGAACALVTTPEIARALGKNDIITIKAIQLVASNGNEARYSAWNGAYLPTTRKAAANAYREAGISKPREQISMAEVHDCFSVTELITMEDLGLADEGTAAHAVLNGEFDRDGSLPCQTDGGLKCFGHPIGASGLRMLYEGYLQLTGVAGERQIPEVRNVLCHNLGGQPHQNICSVTVVGRHNE